MLSADGSILVFASDASNLVDNDTNGVPDIFRKDLKTGAVTRVSTNADGVQADGASDHVSLSADGTKLVFASAASNLVPGDTNKASDVFLKDLATGVVTRIDIAADGSQTNRGHGSTEPVISADGTKVAFRSWASNIVPGDTNGASDVFVKDLKTQTLTRVSTAADGTQAEIDNDSFDPVFSPDGTKVAFVSWAGNLVDGDTNCAPDIFIKDLTTNAITRVSVTAYGTQAKGQSASPVFSSDGTRIAFVSDASNLIDGDTNGTPDIFIKDLTTQVITRVSTGSDGGELKLGGDLVPAFSPDGNRVAFVDSVSKQVYVKDLTTQALTAIAAVPNASVTQRVAFSADGTLLIFVSGDVTLVDGDTNGALDVFAAWTGQTTAATVYDKADRVSSGTSGQLGFADLDAGDTHTVTIKPGDSAVGTLTATVTKEPGNAAGTIAWNYTVDHAAVASLAKGQTKLETFTVTVDDGHGGTADQVVTITVVADNDAPHIDRFGPFTRLSIREDKQEANGNSFHPLLSADGNTLVFASDANNLVEGDTKGVRDIFTKDLRTGVVTRVSIAADGITEANGPSDRFSLSSDGTKLVFVSDASNLIKGETSNAPGIFVKDLATQSITREASGRQSYLSSALTPDYGVPVFSYNGKKIAFTSDDANVFVKDLSTGEIKRASETADKIGGNGGSAQPVFSPDGSKITFFSAASNLVPGDDNGTYDAFLKNLDTGTIERVAVGLNNTDPNGLTSGSVFSPDGKKVYFTSQASNLVENDTNGAYDIFCKDLGTQAITRVSTGSDGSQLSFGDGRNGGGVSPVLSADGTKMAFIDIGSAQIYVKDLVTNELMTVASLPNSGDQQYMSFSPDGNDLVFSSFDSTLVPNDKNNAFDVFKVRVDHATTGFVQDKADQVSVSTSGALPFTDPDAGDTHRVTVTPNDGAVGILSATLGTEPSRDGPGSIAWTYAVDHTAVASLSRDQSKVETFTVTVDDGRGGTAEQVVTITVRGSAPPASPAPSVSTGSTTAASETHDRGDTVSTASLGSTEHSGTETAHVLDAHHGHGLTGFEV